MRIAAEDYESLKAFFVWMCEKQLPLPPALADSDLPAAVLAAAEAKSLVEARRVLGLGIGDLIELTEGSPERTSAIDAALRDAGIMTLSEVRAKFGRAIRAIMKRGALRNEAEYYSLRNAVEAMPEPDQIEAWRLLGEFETRAG